MNHDVPAEVQHAQEYLSAMVELLDLLELSLAGMATQDEIADAESKCDRAWSGLMDSWNVPAKESEK